MPRKSQQESKDGNEPPVEDKLETALVSKSVEPGYVVELAKSGRALCKRCEEKIDLKAIRVGVMLEGEWGLFTNWQHLACTIFHKSCESVEKIDGYGSMSKENQTLILQRWEESQREEDDDMKEFNPDEIVRSAWKYPAEPSSDLLMPLLPYQKEGLGWMLNQEGITVPGAEDEELSGRNITFGGILADEMGMGKTIQAISLMLTNRPSLKDPTTLERWDSSDLSHEFKGSAAERGGTLLVLPTVAIRQWQTEISRFTREGSLTVKVYHGSDRSTLVKDLLGCDVVITSYKVLEMEYRKETAGVKVQCRICGKKFYPEKLRVHRNYFCGESAQRTAAQSKTEKKRSRIGAAAKTADIDDDDDEGEDEIALQKKANKILSNKTAVTTSSVSKSTSGKKAPAVAAKSSVKTANKAKKESPGNSSDIFDSSEEETTMHKNKRGKATPLSATKSSGAKVKAKHAVTSAKSKGKATMSSIDDMSTSSEDEIARQKLENKRRAAAAEAASATKSSSSKKRSLSSSQAQESSATKRLRRGDGSSAKRRGKARDSEEEDEEEVMDVDSEDERPETNINQVLSFDSSEDNDNHTATKSSKTPSASKFKSKSTTPRTKSSTKKNVTRRDNKDDSDSDKVVTDEVVVLVEDIFKSPYRRPQRAAAIIAAQKSAEQFKNSSSKLDDEDDEEEEEDDDEVASADEEESISSSSISDADSDERPISASKSATKRGKPTKATPSSTSRVPQKVQGKIPSSTTKKASISKKLKMSSDIEDDSDEDDVPKKTPVKKNVKSSTPASSSAKTKSKSNSSAKKSQGSSSAKKGRNNKFNGSDDDDDYFVEEDDDDDDDDHDDSEDIDEDDGTKKGSASKSKKSNFSRMSKSSAKPDRHEDVEEDIRIAMSAHLKAMQKANAPKSLLHRISWFRIILDEAHMIKDRSTSTCKAVFNLVSLNKWCLTGTPLQNRVGELYSLIRFLRIDPHAYYFCRAKDCTCKSLHYRFTESRCNDCSHSVIQHFCHFNRHILNPIQRCGYVNEGRRAMLKLKHQILDNILLRRTKMTRADDIQLPMRIVQVRQERMDEKEEDFYEALYTQSQAQFNTYLMAGTVLNNYAHIFDILIRLRQAVDHPYLVIYSDSQGNNSAVTAAAAAADEASRSRRVASIQSSAHNNNNSHSSSMNPEEDLSNGVCGLCQDPLEDAVTTACGHCFCRTCIMDFIDTVSSANVGSSSSNGLKCPHCNDPLTLQLSNNINSNDFNASEIGNSQFDDSNNNFTHSIWNDSKRRRKSILDKIDLKNFQTSTKMEALMEELYRMGEEDVGSKAIVFSQFVNMLDLLEYRIQVGGIGCVKMSGSMTIEQRDKTITTFKEDPSIRVMLISLKAGGVALNLTVASRIFLMDPWWNPAAEMQAIDRTHRIGQYKPIFATRFIIEDSIEERILKLQEKKKLVFDGTVGGDAGSMAKLTVDDMRFLFQ